jgi:hypothetical protein
MDQQQQLCETGTVKQETRTTEADTDDNIVFPIFSKKKEKKNCAAKKSTKREKLTKRRRRRRANFLRTICD